MAVVVTWRSISQSLALLAEGSWMNKRHHILVPGLGSCILINKLVTSSPNSKADSDDCPVVAVLLHLALVDATMRQISSTYQDPLLYHNKLITCYHLGRDGE